MIIVVGGIKGGSGKTTITPTWRCSDRPRIAISVNRRRRSGDREASERVETGLARREELIA
jgi:hypothetical protein